MWVGEKESLSPCVFPNCNNLGPQLTTEIICKWHLKADLLKLDRQLHTAQNPGIKKKKMAASAGKVPSVSNAEVLICMKRIHRLFLLFLHFKVAKY